MSSIRGYSGYYKGSYLRSSYEYVFCKILEKQDLIYKVEEKEYNLGRIKYIPDFHIYNKENVLIEIAETKSEYKKEIDKAKKKIKLLRKIVNVPVNLYRINELKSLCVKYKLDIKKITPG